VPGTTGSTTGATAIPTSETTIRTIDARENQRQPGEGRRAGQPGGEQWPSGRPGEHGSRDLVEAVEVDEEADRAERDGQRTAGEHSPESEERRQSQGQDDVEHDDGQ